MPDSKFDSPVLIQTKLQRPRLRGDLVTRPRLLARLACSTEHKLALISAPAGYGKTTLLCQWLENCPHPSTWLSLDEGDDDWIVFIQYVVAAIQTAYPDACHAVAEVLRSPADGLWEVLATSLVNDLAALPGPLTLALDDYHYIRNPQVHQFLTYVIRYLPRHVNLAIASRTDPPLALDRLRAGRQLVEVRGRDLRFSVEEIDAYLESALGPDLPGQTASLLAERTEGWIVGLHLATLWLQGTEETAGLLADVSGDTPQFVSRYLATEVLAHQPADVQQFLLQTSVLNRFCGELCDAVVPGAAGSSSAMLDLLDGANLFLIPLGERGGWYRYHHLFQEMLRAALQAQVSRDEIANLHHRAGEWFATHGHIEEALHHALAAGDVDAAVKFVEENVHNLLNRLERHTLERWLSLLPSETVWGRPRLLIAQAWLHYRQSRLSALDAVLDAAEACLNGDGDCAGGLDEQTLRGQIHALRSATSYQLREDFEDSLASAERALDWLPTTERGARSTALGFWALAQQGLGNNEAAIRRLEETLNDPTHRGLAGTQLFLGLCLTHYLAGQLHQMLGVTRRFLALAAKRKQANAIVGSNWVSGLCFYELNDLAAAAQHFLQVYQLRYRSNFAATFHSEIGLARTHQLRGDLEAAQEMIDNLRTDTLRLDNPEVLPALDSFQAHQWLVKGETASALRWARSLGAGVLVESPFWFEAPSLTRARILTTAGTDDEVRQVQRALHEKLADAIGKHRVQHAVPLLAHLALAHDRLGERDEALLALEHALTLAEPGGFIRSFVDAGPQLQVLLAQIKQPRANAHYIAELLAAFDEAPGQAAGGAPPPAPAQIATAPDLLLTRREQEVLRLIQQGLTNKEIARELVISPYTVKRHATNIFNKLDAGGRRQAVHKAMQLGVLPSD